MSGTSETTGLADESVDYIFAAQAFHWFDLRETKTEFRRILRPGGFVFLIWNKRQLNSEFLREYEQLVQSIPGYSEVTHHNITKEILRDFLGSAFTARTFANYQEFDFNGLMGRFSSSSYTPKEDTVEYAEARKRLEHLFENGSINGKITFSYETEVYSGKIT